ncbi:MAG: DNRLRE domain-containing protein [Phycisphaera sp.]|nr:DNRLRE domain-containing protein [Phycisphaera sp.]
MRPSESIATPAAALIAACAALASPAAASPHDGIHDGAHGGIRSDGHHRAMPTFAVVAPAPDFVRAQASRFSFGSSAFSLIGIPDTQNYSSSFPQIFTAQTEWVVANRDELDIRYVSHYGDIVNNADNLVQWQRADASMGVLDAAGVPYGYCPGNHDITPSGSIGEPYIPANYLAFFGPDRLEGRPWFGGASPSGMSTYTLFSAGGVEFLQIHLDCDTPVAELAWAQGILDSHKHMPAMLTTHRYLQDAEDYTSGVPLVPSGRYPPVWYQVEPVYHPNGIQAEEFFRWFVRTNANVFLVTCGHFHEEFRQTSVNVAGLPVHEVLADFQDDPNGGDGWMRIMTFDTAASTIEVDTYSPTLAAVRTADESDFTLAVAFDAYRTPAGVAFRAFQQGINGYAGTQDTWVSQQNPNASYGENDTRVSDDDTANSFFADFRGQALVRFDGIVRAAGAEGVGVPLGATVLEATLVLDIADDIDTPLFDPEFLVYAVTRPWNESSTWNSLGNGLSPGDDLGSLLATFSGDNSPDDDSMRRIDITSAVQAWVNGAPNHGVAILPEIISGNDDGIVLRASENTNTILRPRLEVTYVDRDPLDAADLDRDGAVGAVDLALLLSAWGTTDFAADIDDDGIVGASDLARLLGAWG